MIPKNLFFLWFGDNIPDNADWVMESFKEVNPDFHVEFIHYTKKDIENYSSKNDELLTLSYEIAIKNEAKLRKYGLYCTISDYYRSYLIRKYGGIYLDLDTFPLKPFDDELLNINCLYRCTVTREDVKNKYIISQDIYHMGSVRFDNYYSPPKRTYWLREPNIRGRKDKEYLQYLDRFNKKQLALMEKLPGTSENLYIEHFNSKFYKKTR